MRKFIWVIVVAVVSLVGVGGSYVGFLPNLGVPFGYYGDLNRTAAKLKRIQNVQIKGVRCNLDLTLEDFTFDLQVADEFDVSLFFHESPNLTWELFDSSDRLVVARRVRVTENTVNDYRWVFDLGPGSQLEGLVGAQIRGGSDALVKYGRIRQVLESIPPTIPDTDQVNALGNRRTFFIADSSN